MTDEMARSKADDMPWFLKGTGPVSLPEHAALTASEDDFEWFIRKTVMVPEAFPLDSTKDDTKVEEMDTRNMSADSTTADVREDFETLDVDHIKQNRLDQDKSHDDTFMAGLLTRNNEFYDTHLPSLPAPNHMLTINGDLTHRSTNEPLVDLFTELEETISGERLQALLEASWNIDPLATIKIIFNARSIHLGKASRKPFYRCAGWLAKHHPQTLIANLPWLSRPVIAKKMGKRVENDEAPVIVEPDMDEDDSARFDVKNGVAHGYWKDLLNVLALAANDALNGWSNPADVLNVEKHDKRKDWPTREEAKARRHAKRASRHENVVRLFNEDPVYRGLHLAISRIFATQLKKDLAHLHSGDKRDISLCGKWAPSAQRFHDKHTFVVSSIAEILHPITDFSDVISTVDKKDQRTLYLRHAREGYRKSTAALRVHLAVVERDITAKDFDKIHYERVPSIAMNNYAPLFSEKDTERFEKYLDQVASGKARISGATLLPSTLIKAAREAVDLDRFQDSADSTTKRKGTHQFINAKMRRMMAKTVDGQWNTLLQRVNDSGILNNCIAVADVSGSMLSPVFRDGTCPLDSSIGLALLIAEVTKHPFGGAFITFSAEPTIERVDPGMSLLEKYAAMQRAKWDLNTDFVAVFDRLILPMAVKNELAREDMVKRVFVFSDMQFDGACDSGNNPEDRKTWATSYERITKKFEAAGYDMPELVFWNLAGGRDDGVAPKPVAAKQKGTALVSGYSQGMLKVFLEGGSFEDDDEEGEIVERIGEDGEVVVDKVKKQKLDPMSLVQKAISHQAYDMLRVVD